MKLLLFLKTLKSMTCASVFNSIISDTSGQLNAMLRPLENSSYKQRSPSDCIVECFLAHIIGACLDCVSICTIRSDSVSHFLSRTRVDAQRQSRRSMDRVILSLTHLSRNQSAGRGFPEQEMASGLLY